ncbi:MAG: hypothetical protein LBK72_02150 [Bifidobacteriaceae bacterium]|jgi:tetratricopeptide (TPR) repeat protein|nr:hypothetical protein [Bifidobacteriaceae bacterium]
MLTRFQGASPPTDFNAVIYWRFSSGTSYAGEPGVTHFLHTVINILDPSGGNALATDNDRVTRLRTLLQTHTKTLLVLDDFEPLASDIGAVGPDWLLRNLIDPLAGSGLHESGSMILIGSTRPLGLLDALDHGANHPLPKLSVAESTALMGDLCRRDPTSLADLASKYEHYPLVLALMSKEMEERGLQATDLLLRSSSPNSGMLDSVYEYYDSACPPNSKESTALRVLSLFRHPASLSEIKPVLHAIGNDSALTPIRADEWDSICTSLECRGFLVSGQNPDASWTYLLSPRVLRDHVRTSFAQAHPEEFRRANAELARLAGSRPVVSPNPTLVDLRHVYDQISYLCQAALYADALNVYWNSLCRQRQFYTQKVLGAFLDDIQLLSLFFNAESWTVRDDLDLSKLDEAWLRSLVAYLLNALGRFPEAEALRHEEIALHISLGHHLLASQDLAMLAMTQMYQCELSTAIESLGRARALLDAPPISDQAMPPVRYTATLTASAVELRVTCRLALAHYFANQYTDAVRELHALPSFSDSDPLSGLFLWVILLDPLDKRHDAPLPSPRHLHDDLQAFLRQSKDSHRPDARAFASLITALADWRAGAPTTTVCANLNQSITLLHDSGRMDVPPLVLLLACHVALALCERAFSQPLLALVNSFYDQLRGALHIHHPDLFSIEAQLVNVRRLLLIGQPGTARDLLDRLVESDSRALTYWADAISHLKARTLSERSP